MSRLRDLHLPGARLVPRVDLLGLAPRVLSRLPFHLDDGSWYPYFERLRSEAPVHWCRQSRYGAYWSVCKYKDIMHVEINHGTYSSELGGIAVEDPPKGLARESFIRMDPPKHDEQRKVVGPIVAPPNLAEMEATSNRLSSCRCLDRHAL